MRNLSVNVIRLSVIICTYNRADILRKTLGSLLNQEGFEDGSLWELLIVDNNSNDHTRKAVENFIAETKLNAHYIFEKLQGKSFALNTGITNSKGQTLAFTDDDVIVDKAWVASIIEARAKYPHKAFGGKVIPLWINPPPPWIRVKGPYSRPIFKSAIPCHDMGDDVREYREDMWVPVGGNMFFSREVFEKYGRFRTDLGPKGELLGSYEDSEMGFRIKNNGEKILYYPKAIVYHPVRQEKVSQEYLLKYFWYSGRTEAKIDCFPSIMGRCKAVIRCTLALTTKVVGYLAIVLTKDDPAARMHYLCLLYRFSGKLSYYMTDSAIKE